MCVKEIKQPGSEGQIQMASVFILKMRILRQKEQECRLGLCLAHSITMSGMWRFDQRLERRGKLWAAPFSWIPWQEAKDYACAPPGKKTRLKMTISNTLTVRSGRFLTAPAIRWSRLYMTAHSYAGYAVTFHCILINTWLNQARTTLLITQDKKTRQKLSTPNLPPIWAVSIWASSYLWMIEWCVQYGREE